MSLTRLQYRERIVREMDAITSGRWDQTAGGEVDQKLGVVFDQNWRRILNANRYYRIVKRTPTSDADGKYAISDLSDLSSPDSAKRLYRVLALAVEDVVYEEVAFIDNILTTVHQQNYRTWWREGEYIQCTPVLANKVASGIWVNYLPTRPENLSDDAQAVDFPDGYEQILIWEAAALLLSKAGAESGAGAELKDLASELKQDMLQDLTRFSTKPMQMIHSDEAGEWGG
ncbi:MAG TPA: hypothetical protein VMX15_00060 [Candidatus Heimdallarchaeota archaeon]|nr:hypothetical protein [Candidatus Heimdallarchaeota archaeon]